MFKRSSAVLTLLVVASFAHAADAPVDPTAPGEPNVKRTVIEDEGVRIEETRVRGQVTRVVVRSKQADVRPYEVLVGTAARDPSQRGQGSGQRVWHLFSF